MIILETIFLQGSFDIKQFAFPIALIAILYFFMVRPQLAKQKKERKFQDAVKQGAKVVMTSGIHGKISEINTNNNTVVIETGAGKIRFERSAISMSLSQQYINK